MRNQWKARIFAILTLLGWTVIGGGARLWGAALTDHTSKLFSGSGNCAFCHDSWGGALRDKAGNDLSIAGDWRATMMAHSYKDPFWRARMEAEVRENPALKDFIEDKCRTCHAPMARTQARQDNPGQNWSITSALAPLADDGVSCTLCHQIRTKGLGQPPSFSGGYTIGNQREIFGPYRDVVTMPMIRHVDYTPKFGRQVQQSELCATCHTLFTPIFNAAGKISGSFPEQVPYLEWRNSAYAKEGKQCQDCHMPRLDEPIKTSARPPWIGTREPFWRHQFVGGNAFMLGLLSRDSQAVAANAEPEHFSRMIHKTRSQLGQAVKLEAKGRREAGRLVLDVQVKNLAGHKFPTGYPYRRAWLHVRVQDRDGQTIFESGATDDEGRIRGGGRDYSPHYQTVTKPEEVQIYEAVMGSAEKRMTRSLLKATEYLKDNRLPPRGFSPDGADGSNIATRGRAADDPDFHANRNGRDQVTYQIAVQEAVGPVQADVEMLYQPVPPEAVADLLRSPAPAAKVFADLYSRSEHRTEQVQAVRLSF